ncbi:hypothetical protein [Laspinema olomoucense]|uniref:Uncharacterized protein n=1 Tax=Laspinema olomoucense D3b TaxID=2953688 RepID=A0ABT2N6N5_9CYAN|nr:MULTISPECIES: hypothetical protein [unclassified Laspinema]MCT7972366.1 hypothetical protein [Laspinema sp. D3d]MCT7977489.1 hypothetical protein [Laspinema sp. D3b]MCT7986903.1 hypothetical protein [Laspinema sp. D3a]MCT7995323.1 hypothetical protein [Laspinema sp. D3c]
MESLQNQVYVLNHKVDELYQTIEQLNRKISLCLGQQSLNVPPPSSESPEALLRKRYAYAIGNLVSTTLEESEELEHKDVLKEKNGRNEREKTVQNNIDSELSPEIQIRRLTAQLTAAYHRIAELEEQLMAKRV